MAVDNGGWFNGIKCDYRIYSNYRTDEFIRDSSIAEPGEMWTGTRKNRKSF